MNNKKTIRFQNNCRLILQKDKKFKYIGVEVVFYDKFDYKNITAYNVLSRILLNSSKVYKTMKEMNQKKEELYDVELNTSYKYWYKLATFKVIGNFINPKYVNNKNYEEEIFSFLSSTIFNQNIVNHSFDKDLFNIAKDLVANSILLQKDQPDSYAFISLLKMLGTKKQAIAASTIGEKKVLDELNASNLVDYYLHLINLPFDIYVYGDIQFEKIKRLVKKYFNNQTTTRKKYQLQKALNPNNIKNKVIYRDVLQAKVAICYTTGVLYNDKDYYAMRLLNNLFGENQQSKLFQEIREKQGLCYSIFSTFDSVYGTIIVYTGIPIEKVKETISAINQLIDDLKEGKISNKDIEMAKIDIISSLNQVKDNMFKHMNLEIRAACYNQEYDVEKIINLYQKITKNDLIEVAKKIQYKTHVVVTKKGK